MSFALRIDTGLTEVKAWLTKHEIGGFAVRELAGTNEHWHFLLDTAKTIKQLRCSFNRECPELKGNGKYSLTECRDLEKYLRYMAKGESEGQLPEVAWRFGLQWTDEKLAELHDAYWKENRALKRRKVGSLIDWVIDECKRKNVHWNDRAAILEIYIREQGARGKPINLYAVRSSVNSVQFALCPDDSFLRTLVERCEQY